MCAKRKIATQNEVLEHLTQIMRREADEAVKISDSISAADKLYKMLSEKVEKEKKLTGVVILPEEKKEGEA